MSDPFLHAGLDTGADHDVQRLIVIGQGYVGLPLAMRAVESGFDVVGVDIDIDRVRMLNDGRSPVEDVPSATLAAAVESRHYVAATAPFGHFDYAIVTVPTPLTSGGDPDLSFIEESAKALAPFVTRGATVVLESTTYPGTTEELFGPLLEEGSGLKAGIDFFLGYSPERIDPGNARWSLQTTPKVVSGIDAASAERVLSLYRRLVETCVVVSSTKVAELTKLLENTFRHVNIALVNELAMFAHQLDIDVWEAIDAASTKPFGFMPFRPGPGVGGHCLPVDPSYLSWRVRNSLGQSFRFVELANDVNHHMPDYVVRRVIEAFNDRSIAVRGRTVLVVGIAYKPNTSDARESPAVRVTQKLVELGARVRVVDSHVAARHVPVGADVVTLSEDELRAADGVVLLVDHDDIDLTMIEMHASYVLDCRNRLSGPNVDRL